jgi:N4-gp56 family major capsid protein
MDSNSITYGGDIAPRVGIACVALLLETAQPLMVTQRFATQEVMQKNVGDTLKWRRYEPWAPATQPLTEGVAPTKQPLVKKDYTAILREYGAWSELTSKVVDLHPDNVLGVLTKNCGRQAAQTFEELTFNVLKAGTNVYYAGTGTTRATVNGTIARKDLQLVVRGFRRNDVMPISSIIKASAMISTKGVEESYFAMAHPDMEADIRHITGFTTVVEYGNADSAVPGEIGKAELIRFVLSRFNKPILVAATSSSGSTYLTNGASGTGYPDVYTIVVVGKDAYGVVRLQGMKSVQFFVAQPGEPRPPVDPLGQTGSVGWRAYWAGAILNDYAVARIECAATANPNW